MNNKIMDNKINFNNTYSYAQILSAIRDLRQNGLPKGYSLGIPELDERIILDKGKLCTISGMPNLGKSEFTDFICTQLNKLHGFKTLFFSAEDTLAMHVSKLIQKYKFEEKTSMEEQAKFLSENFGFIDYDKVYTIDKLMKVAEEEISCKKYDVLVIDPFNKFDAEKPYNVNMTDYISKFLDKLIRFTKKNNIITLLVAHPRKPYNKDIPSAYDIADSAHFYNKSDYCIIVHGDTNNFTTLIRVEKVKYKHLGIKGEITLKYDDRSGNFYYEEDELDYIFGKPQPVTETTTKDYLDIDVDYFKSIQDIKPKTINLKGLLFGNNSKLNNELVEKIRNTSDKKDRQELKKGLLNFAINCRFKDSRSANNVSEKTGLVYIDIDFQDNIEIIDKIPNILKSIQNVAFYKKSCSGNGYQAIIPYSKSLDFTKVWYSIESDFKDLGIVIDSATKDISRVTFYSYDPDYYYNPNADAIDLNAFVDTHNPYALFEQKRKLAQQEKEQDTLSKAPNKPSDPDSTAMEHIKQLLNPKSHKEKPPVYVPKELNDIIADLKSYIEQTGVIVPEIINIQYGKKIRFEMGLKKAEVNLFFGKNGFSVVQSPRSGTNAELNRLMAELVTTFIDSL